jgi:hypothetical protein
MSNRTTLQGYFVKNAIPTESNFSDLITSALVQPEDSIRKQGSDPIAIQAQQADQSGTQQVLHFYKNFTDANAAWKFSLLTQNATSPASGLNLGNPLTVQSSLFIKESDGSIGIGTTNPLAKLHVSGGNTVLDGNVGIGTTSPATTLDVNGTGWFRSNAKEAQATVGQGIKISTQNNVGYIYSYDYNSSKPLDLVLQNPGGNVGIGTNTPGFPLTFKNALGEKISFWGQSGNSYGIGIQSSLLQLYTDTKDASIAFGYGSSSSFTETMRIMGNGNVGIGTTTPTYKLTLGGTGHFAVDNSSCFLAKNKDAVYEIFLWPRWNDDVMYLNYGKQGFHIRNNDSTTAMFIKPDGNVGIGTANPRSKLDFAQVTSTAAGTLNTVFARLSEGDGEGAGTYLGVSAYATQAPINIKSFAIEHSFYGNINSSVNFCRGGSKTGGYITFNVDKNTELVKITSDGLYVKGAQVLTSDIRIKHKIAPSNEAEDLDIISKLKVKEYFVKANHRNDSLLQKGFIAQEVEGILPGAVVRQNDFIPDIYAQAESAVINEELLVITMKDNHRLKNGDIVRFITSEGNKERGITVINDKTFSVDNWKGDISDLFVYGKMVDDFRTVNYNAIFTLGISAIQELYKQLQGLKEELSTIKMSRSSAAV